MGAVVAKHVDMGVATGLTTATTEQLPKEEEGAGVGAKRSAFRCISSGASVLPASAGMARSHSPAWAPDRTQLRTGIGAEAGKEAVAI